MSSKPVVWSNFLIKYVPSNYFRFKKKKKNRQNIYPTKYDNTHDRSLHKKLSFPLRISSVNGKLHFLCSAFFWYSLWKDNVHQKFIKRNVLGAKHDFVLIYINCSLDNDLHIWDGINSGENNWDHNWQKHLERSNKDRKIKLKQYLNYIIFIVDLKSISNCYPASIC